MSSNYNEDNVVPVPFTGRYARDLDNSIPSTDRMVYAGDDLGSKPVSMHAKHKGLVNAFGSEAFNKHNSEQNPLVVFMQPSDAKGVADHTMPYSQHHFENAANGM